MRRPRGLPAPGSVRFPPRGDDKEAYCDIAEPYNHTRLAGEDYGPRRES